MSEDKSERALRLLEEIHHAVVEESGTRKRPKQNGPYTCQYCGEEFEYSWNLGNHVQVEHIERPSTRFVDGSGAQIGDDISAEILKTIDALPGEKLTVKQISGFVECSAEGNVPRLWKAGALHREKTDSGLAYWLSDEGREFLEDLSEE